MRPRVIPVVVMVPLSALALLAAACGGEAAPAVTPSASSSVTAASPPATASPSPSSSPSAPTGPEVRAFLALCSVVADVALEDLVRAEATFHDQVHEALHELAEDVQPVDRAVAADLLEAKYRVEADLAQAEPDADRLASDLQTLIGAMTSAMSAVQIAAPPCTQEVP